MSASISRTLLAGPAAMPTWDRMNFAAVPAGGQESTRERIAGHLLGQSSSCARPAGWVCVGWLLAILALVGVPVARAAAEPEPVGPLT
jgi:hypothetical protein